MHGYRLVSGGITRTVAGDPWHNLLMMSIKGGFTVPTDPVFVPTQFSCLRRLRWLRGLLPHPRRDSTMLFGRTPFILRMKWRETACFTSLTVLSPFLLVSVVFYVLGTFIYRSGLRPNLGSLPNLYFTLHSPGINIIILAYQNGEGPIRH